MQVFQRVHHTIGQPLRGPGVGGGPHRFQRGVGSGGVLGGGDYLEHMAGGGGVGVHYRNGAVGEIRRRLHCRVVSAAQQLGYGDADGLMPVRYQRRQLFGKVGRGGLRGGGQARAGLQPLIEFVAGQVEPLAVGHIVNQHIGRHDGNAQALGQVVRQIRRAVRNNLYRHNAQLRVCCDCRCR